MIVTPAGPSLERQSIQGSDGLLKVPFFEKFFFLNINQTLQK